MIERIITFEEIVTAAHKELIEQEIHTFPLDPRKLQHDGLIVCSAQDYAEMVGDSIDKILARGKVMDGFIARNVKPGINMAVYDERAYSPRMEFTILHEIGHLVLRTCREDYANLFASECKAPLLMLREIERKGYHLQYSMIMTCFGMSRSAAEYRIDELRFKDPVQTEFDSLMLRQFYDYLTCTWPYHRLHMSTIDIFTD